VSTEETHLMKPDSSIEVYLRLLKELRRYWVIFIGSILGMWLFSAMEIAFVDLLGYLVNVLTVLTTGQSPDGPSVSIAAVDSGLTSTLAGYFIDSDDVLAQSRIVIPVMILVVALLRGVGFVVGQYGMGYISQHVVDNLRNQVFEKYTRMPSAYFDRNMSGHLVTQLTFHVQQVMGAVTSALKVILREGFLVIGLLSYLIYLNWQLAATFFCVIPFIAIIIRYVSKRFRKLSNRIQDAMGDVTQVANEAVSGYRETRLFGGEDYEIGRMHAASRQNCKQSLKLTLTESLSSPVVQFLVACALAALIWLALVPDLLGSMTTGGFTKFLVTAGLLAKPIRQLTQVNSVIQRGIAAASVLFETLDSIEEVDEGTYTTNRVEGRVIFDKVSFRYGRAADDAVREVSFTVEPGKSIALVGSSGSGKSTLVSLIPRFYNYSAGRILLDDREITEYSLRNLRSHISLVSQQVTLFNDTVYNNIAYGELASRSREEVLAAAADANALEFIEDLPDGFDTIIGDDGVMLSGGQRQRIAIARALLKNAPILILDEATSALDTESERYIQQALEKAMAGRTTFVIAHRLSTVENADCILVLENGSVVESGRHQALLDARGRYAFLYNNEFVQEGQ
jgi:ATP-binding cassette, subfamily B, bacterial MsbA